MSRARAAGVATPPAGQVAYVVRIGYMLASEEHRPADLVRQAKLAEQTGFNGLWISDHYHPWNDKQGQSPFVWSTIGALSQVTRLPVTTAVTCPTVRIHPAVVAQATAMFVEAGYDEVYIQQIGPEQEGFFAFYADHILPKLSA
jgi:hypothetical protein